MTISNQSDINYLVEYTTAEADRVVDVSMKLGDVIATRFTLERAAGSGGMGMVWRAQDQLTGRPVAIKVLQGTPAGGSTRFSHEVQILAALDHPHIVRYVAHGFMPEGAPFLAMEWLEGRDLAERLQDRGLTIEETLLMARHVAAGLGLAHARGIVHRDVKPSNLFLVADDPAQIRILDFGIARLSSLTHTLTRTGSVLGTPGYMAPEQARGERQIAPAADVFSLGCVMFECLTGQPAFRGSHVIALLAKLLLEEPPDVTDVRPEVPEILAELVSRMLSKSPSLRPTDGAASEAALASVDLSKSTSVAGAAPTTRLTATERRLVSVVVAAPEPAVGVLDATISEDVSELPEHLSGVRAAVEVLGAKLEVLANGMLFVMLVGVGTPTDQATAAARCALRMRALLPGAAMALMTGRSETNLRLSLGEVLEKAMRLLDAATARREWIDIDDVTHSLLDTRFEIVEQDGRTLLCGERLIGEEPRRLLGRPSPFVGRDRELRSLQEQIEDGFAEPSAQALLVTGPAGIGKSRMRQELVRRLLDARPKLMCAVGRADSQGAGAPLASLRAALRSALGIVPSDPLERQRARLAAFVERLELGDEARQVIDFIGELAGVPFPADNSPRLHAARHNPQIMATQIELAFVAFLRALARQQPILLVLEDLHWGDSASVRLLDAALRELDDLPLAVLAFARPEVHDVFPKLWGARSFMELRLSSLNRRAAEQLIESMLGDAIDAPTKASIIERSGGNVFYLEELIRAVAAGRAGSLPDTVLGMVEARLDVLSLESRKLLRAASIFGECFWIGGLRPLLGEPEASMTGMLDELVAQEFLLRRTTSRFAEQEYVFRHALMREGAYAMLTERDRTLGHKLAGEWLEGVGEQDPVVLANHFELGAEPAKEANWRVIAAEKLLRGGDPFAALDSTERVVVLGPEGDTAEHLWALRAEAGMAAGGRGFPIAIAATNEALRVIDRGSRRFGQTLYGGIGAALVNNDIDAAKAFMGVLLTVEPDPGQVFAIAPAFSMAVATLMFAGQRDAAALYLERIQSLIGDGEEPEALAWAWLTAAHWEFWAQRNPWAALQGYLRARQLFELVGDRASQRIVMAWLINCHGSLGTFEQADELSAEAHRQAPDKDLVLTGIIGHSMCAIVERGDCTRAIEYARASNEQGLLIGGSMPHMIFVLELCDAHLMCGDINEAERILDGSGADDLGIWITDTTVHGLRARILLARGDATAAAREAEQAMSRYRESGIAEWFRFSATLLVRAEAYHAAGDAEAAKRAIREARDDLLARAELIEDPVYRRSFIERIPVHVRTLALADAWLG
jgi:tetratricopeptide (TPR) repeat protein